MHILLLLILSGCIASSSSGQRSTSRVEDEEEEEENGIKQQTGMRRRRWMDRRSIGSGDGLVANNLVDGWRRRRLRRFFIIIRGFRVWQKERYYIHLSTDTTASQPASQKSEVSRRSERFGLVINRVTTLSKEAAEEEEKKENQSASQLLLTFPRNKCTYNAQVVIKCDSITLVWWKGRWRLESKKSTTAADDLITILGNSERRREGGTDTMTSPV